MVGDVYQVLSSVINGAYLEVKPAAGKQVVIHNVYHMGDVTLKMVVGTDELPFFADAGQNVVTNMYLHVSNTQFLRIYNVSGVLQFLAADGVYTKDT